MSGQLPHGPTITDRALLRGPHRHQPVESLGLIRPIDLLGLGLALLALISALFAALWIVAVHHGIVRVEERRSIISVKRPRKQGAIGSALAV